MKKITRGFTLIELMIVVVVIAILAAIALPAYGAYIQRANRAHAKAALLNAAQWMERVATAQGVYPTVLGAGLDVVEGNRYTVGFLAGTTPTKTGFTLVAQRISSAANANDPCGDFTLTSAGVRDTVNRSASMTNADCWAR